MTRSYSFGPMGAAEALRKAKEQGKVRFLGFTGHKDLAVHLKMIETGFPSTRCKCR